MIAIKVENEIVTAQYIGNNPPSGFIEVYGDIPIPEFREGYIPVLCYKDNELVYEYEQIPLDNDTDDYQIKFLYRQTVQSEIHKRYSIDDEIAILRKEISKIQQDNSSEEFMNYNEYAEKCKKTAKDK